MTVDQNGVARLAAAQVPSAIIRSSISSAPSRHGSFTTTREQVLHLEDRNLYTS